MKFSKYYPLTLLLAACGVGAFFNNCSGSFQSSGPATSSGTAYTVEPQSQLANTLTITGAESNIVPITMSQSETNFPLVNVTVCVPGTTSCQTISNILLDTGSTGLRIFRQALSINLPQLVDSSSGRSFGECYQFGSAFVFWGSVDQADIKLGGTTGSKVNLQVMDSSFASVPSDCSLSGQYTVATGPSQTGYNGILGVLNFALDCGSDCTPDSTNAIYYTCANSACTSVTMADSAQVPNPISALSTNNNGFVIQFPNVSSTGSTTAPGAYLVLGIGTQADNMPVGTHALPMDSYGEIDTVFAGVDMPYSVFDTGTNDLDFPPPSSPTIPTCSFDSMTAFCPASPMPFSALVAGTGGSGTPVTLDFQLMNGESAFLDPVNTVFPNIGEPITDGSLSADGSGVTQMFDWGLPIFFGKTIFFGMDIQTITGIGNGPIMAL